MEMRKVENSDIEKVEAYEPNEFLDYKKNMLDYLKFAENEQHKLEVTSPQKLKTKRFGEEKLMIRLTVLSIDGVQCNPPKKWDIGNTKLWDQLMPILAMQKPSYSMIVKRGPGQNKGVTYTVMEV